MRSSIRLLLLFWIITSTVHAQNDHSISLNIDDFAPSLRVQDWLKGTPIQKFEKGNVYVVEFWATWCKPCIASMPHLSALATQYKASVIVLGIDILEKKSTSLVRIKNFVDSMGDKMKYRVAVGDTNFTVADWFNASGEQGIPKSFVVNAEGKLAWIGHPKDLDEVLRKVVDNTWNIKEALAKRNMNRRLGELDDSLNYELNEYEGDPYKPGDLGKPDSALLIINEMIRKEPMLKYAPLIANHTFSALLKTDPHKAYEYGKVVLETTTYDDPPYSLITGSIEWYSNKLKLPVEIYELGAEAYRDKIDMYEKFGNMNIPNDYKKMADMYWRANNKLKAIEAMEKAIKTLKKEKNFSKTDLDEYSALFRKYKNQ
ncbi:MAG TPA: TlpA disulfide reductase family protein [Chitinophagaceae bacterium]|nr:TlpA disulfide reductase family protein [Chitinophagaceae bacterium]